MRAIIKKVRPLNLLEWILARVQTNCIEKKSDETFILTIRIIVVEVRKQIY